MVDKNIEALRGRIPHILEHEQAIKNAVLVPLVDFEGETCILFEKRAAHMKQQPGEICFPGGGVEDNDEGNAESAIRETCEELGLAAEDIDLIAPLDILITPFNFIIHPFVGYLKDYVKIKPNPEEVEEIFCVPLSFLRDYQPITSQMSIKLDAPPDYPYELIPYGKDYPFRQSSYPQHFYIWKDFVIWGLTARILNHFLSLLPNNSANL